MRGRRRRALWRNPWLRVGVAVVVVSAVLFWIDRDESHAGLDPADADTVEVDLETYTPNERLGYEPVLVGDLLLSRVNRGDINDPDNDLVASTDLGATWTTVVLPARPDPVQELRIHDLGSAVVVTAELPWPRRERNARVWIWISIDGVTWTGGAVAVPRPGDKPASVSGVWATADGGVVARINTSDDIERAVRSEDGGITWSETQCPRDTEPSAACERAPRQHGQLWVRSDGSVSLDDGETWQFPDLPGIGEEDLASLDVVEAAGGWFAVATAYEDDGSDGWDERFLLRSVDGIDWELVFEADSRCWTGFPGEWISTPVPYGDQFLVAYTCDNPDDPLPGPLLSQLYLLDAAGTALTAITAITDTHDDNHTYGQPFVVGPTVLVARFEFTHGDISMLRLDLPA